MANTTNTQIIKYLLSQILTKEAQYGVVLSNQSIMEIMFLLNGYAIYLGHEPFSYDFVKTQFGPVDVHIKKMLDEGIDYVDIEQYIQDQTVITISNLIDSLVQYSNNDLDYLTQSRVALGAKYTKEDTRNLFVNDFDLEPNEEPEPRVAHAAPAHTAIADTGSPSDSSDTDDTSDSSDDDTDTGDSDDTSDTDSDIDDSSDDDTGDTDSDSSDSDSTIWYDDDSDDSSDDGEAGSTSDTETIDPFDDF